jgi:hypothetical protein
MQNDVRQDCEFRWWQHECLEIDDGLIGVGGLLTDQLGHRHGNVDFQLSDVPLRHATRQQSWHKSKELSNNPACFVPWPLGTELVSSVALTPSYGIAHF